MGNLQGKTVFVTGASSGIGRSTAIAFAREGCRLLLCARRRGPLEALTKMLADSGVTAEVHVFQLDVQDRSAVETAIANLPSDWKEIDVLVNNAGLSRGLTKLYEDDPQNWEEMIDTNVKGLLYVTRSIVPGMVARGRGHVINLGSTAAHITYANGAVYCASKAAEKSISEGLKIDLMGTAVRVTSVDAGMVETNFSNVRFRGDEERAAKVYQNITPLQPEDVADAIVWAASRPAHVNIHTVVMTTIDQANSTIFHRH
ncbi:MAG TPA: SDR family NAD(P)-dependent oxidoreductase [Edaphobacter sp.]|jgi:3-hydroxy acid dehydrogenase/malonic semialdehyde reductase|nr:SDR family NAD(P)-dependent oxidoreductase [Edaphobacter sp.]